MNQKLTLEFNMEDPMAREAYQECLNAGLYVQLLIAVQEEIFRPARKHGYTGMNSGKLNRLLEIPEVAEAIELLEELYYRQKDTYLNTSTF
jgi:predicted ester cyclase